MLIVIESEIEKIHQWILFGTFVVVKYYSCPLIKTVRFSVNTPRVGCKLIHDTWEFTECALDFSYICV